MKLLLVIAAIISAACASDPEELWMKFKVIHITSFILYIINLNNVLLFPARSW